MVFVSEYSPQEERLISLFGPSKERDVTGFGGGVRVFLDHSQERTTTLVSQLVIADYVVVRGNTGIEGGIGGVVPYTCLLYTSPSPRDRG